MSFYQDKFVITGNARVLWDGITRPTAVDGGGQRHTLKVAHPASAPEIAELDSIAKKALSEDSKFRGQLPPGGIWPLNDIQQGEYENLLVGHKVFNTVSYQAPDVYDANGDKLDPMQYSAMFYPGATVQLIVCAKTYDNVSKGVKYELHGIKIVDATSPKLPVPSSVDAAAAFSQAPATQTAPAGNMSPPNADGAILQTPAAAPSVPAPMAAPAAASAPPAPGPITPAPDFLTYNGQQYTADQLRGYGWTEEQIDGIR